MAVTNRILCTRIQEKGAVILQETDPDLPISVQKPLVETWVGSGCYRARCTKYSRHAWDLLKKAIIFILSP